MNTLNQTKRMGRAWVSAGLLALLAACGGGGGGDGGDDSPVPPTPNELDTRITLAGVVSKGRLGRADVRVLAVDSQGKADESQVLATGVVQDDGRYVTTEFRKPPIYVVEASARPCGNLVTGDGCTFHQDEATGQPQYLPQGFKLRAVVLRAPERDGVARVNLTVLSELAYGAAIKADGGLTAANAQWALNMANGLAGVADLNTVEPVAYSPTATCDSQGSTLSCDQIRVAALLAAVSRAASSSTALTEMGCDLTSAGTPQATLCVVNKLSANAQMSTYVGEDPRVSAALSAELDDVVAGNAQAQALLASSGDKLTDPDIKVPAPVTSPAIASIKSLVQDLTSAVQTLLDSGATPGSGAIQDQARAFQQAVSGAQHQVDASAKAVSALLMAVKLWEDFEQTQERTSELWYSSFGLPNGLATGVGCTLQKAQGTGFTALAPGDAPAAVARVFCYADAAYEVDWSKGVNMGGETTYPARNPFHWFAVTRTNTAGVYAYSTGAWEDSRRVTIHHPTGQIWDKWIESFCLQAASRECTGEQSFAGTVTTARSSNGRHAAIRLSGKLADAFDGQAHLLNGEFTADNLANSTVEIQAALENPVYAGDDLISARLNLSGEITAFNANGSTEASRVSIAPPSFVVMADSAITAFSLTLDARTPGARLSGKLVATGSAAQGGQGSFEGALYNLAGSAQTPFISAKLTTEIDNTHHNPNLPASASNYQIATVDFDGYITAPSHPRIGLKLTASGKKAGARLNFGTTDSDTLAGNFRLYSAQGAELRDVTMTLIHASSTNAPRLNFVDSAHGISFWLQEDVRTSDVLVNGSKWGLIDREAGQMHFVNGEFISLDFGQVSF